MTFCWLQAVSEVEQQGRIDAHQVLTGFFEGLSSFFQGADANAFDLAKQGMCGSVSSNINVAIQPTR